MPKENILDRKSLEARLSKVKRQVAEVNAIQETPKVWLPLKFGEQMQAMQTDIVHIKGTLEILSDMTLKRSPAVEAHSPIRLTDIGREIGNGIGAESIIARNWDTKILPAMALELHSKNPYDVQQYCMIDIPSFPEKFFDAKDIDDVKLYAFKHGHALFWCFQVLGIVIRDKYLSSIGINVSEIDNHSPQS